MTWLPAAAIMIDSRQIRAARALLAWSQQELADRTRLSLTAMNRVERNATDARGSTLFTIREVLAEAIQLLYDDREIVGEPDLLDFAEHDTHEGRRGA